MPINLELVQTQLVNWAKAQLPANFPVILYYENAPRPPTDYITININTFIQVGQDYVPRPQDNPGDVEQIGDREFTVNIQAYGGNTIGNLEILRRSLQKQTVLDTLRANGIVFAQQFQILDITELVNTRFEKRASMDILFRMGQTYGDELGSISTVEIEGEFLQGDVVVVDTEITVTIEPTP